MKTIFGTLILFSITPMNFTILMSLLLFLEYLVVKSIIGDIGVAHVKRVIHIVKNYRLKLIFLRYFQPKTPRTPSKKNHIRIKEIPDAIGVTMGYIRINKSFS